MPKVKLEVKLDYTDLRRRDYALYRCLIFEVARLFIDGKNHREIKEAVLDWAWLHARAFCSKVPTSNINEVWVGRRLAEARNNDYQFLRLGPFEEHELVSKIKHAFPYSESIDYVIAPDADALYRQVWLDFDEILTKKVSASDDETIIVAVSGGTTMLSFARAASTVRGLRTWDQTEAVTGKWGDKVAVYSLTSGGIRSRIEALSDTIASQIASELRAQAHGLLGPALFRNKDELQAFKRNREVRDHIRLATKADIILTSVGDVRDKTALTSRMLSTIDANYYAKKLCVKHAHLGDILYNCFDGATGEAIEYPARVRNRIFSVLTCQELQTMVTKKCTECIVVATGAGKGRHAIRGVILGQLASKIYMDIECAKAVLERVVRH